MCEKIRTYIVDDEYRAIKSLQKRIDNHQELELVGTATDPFVAASEIPKLEVKLVFVDMIMEGMSGIELIKTLGPDYTYICCTAYNTYSYQLSPLDVSYYLLKSKPTLFNPVVDLCIKNMRVKEVGNRTLEIEKLRDEGRLLIRVRTQNRRLYLPFEDIEVLMGKGDDTIVYCKDQIYTASGPLKNFEKLLPSLLFVRTNRGCIVARKLIVEQIGRNKLGLMRGSVMETVPVSERYKAKVLYELDIPK